MPVVCVGEGMSEKLHRIRARLRSRRKNLCLLNDAGIGREGISVLKYGFVGSCVVWKWIVACVIDERNVCE